VLLLWGILPSAVWKARRFVVAFRKQIDAFNNLFEALRCPKELVQFSSAEGAGGHCETMNRSAVNRRAADWLHDVFGS
jgi:hypothetical protein